MGISTVRTDEEITRIYNKFTDTVYRVCFVMLKSSEETEDAVQNVFIKFMREGREFQSDEHIKAWLIVTAKNECKNMLKHWFRSKRSDFDDIPEPVYEDKGKSDLIEQVMSLDKKYCLPIYLYYYEGYSNSEIAEMLGLNYSTLRTYMAKGREKLKILLEEDGYGL